MAGKSAANAILSIQNSKKRSLDRLVYALGIRHVGKTIAELLASKFNSLEELSEVKLEDLTNIDGIGPKIAKSIVEYFLLKSSKNLISKIKKAGIEAQIKTKKIKDSKISGKTLVITGTLESMTRNEAEDLIKSLGGRAISSISKST